MHGRDCVLKGFVQNPARQKGVNAVWTVKSVAVAKTDVTIKSVKMVNAKRMVKGVAKTDVQETSIDLVNAGCTLKSCMENGCTNQVWIKDWCKKHYKKDM